MDTTLRLGNTGPAVKKLIGYLVHFGHADISLLTKSTFSDAVKTAVISFQSRHLDPTGHPLVPDGIVGPLTWWALSNPEHEFKPTVDQHVWSPDNGSPGYLALMIAKHEIEIGAGEQGANNDGPDVLRYVNGLAKLPCNWCAAFVSYCFSESALAPMPFTYSLSARGIKNEFDKKGWSYNPKSDMTTPRAGDLVFWWRGIDPNGWQGHIGLVAHYQDGVLYTAEGNKGPFPCKANQFNYIESRMEKLLGFGRVPS